MAIKPCPDDCQFDWVKFHQNLDTAIAHMVINADTKTPIDDYFPSKVSLLRFMEFSDTNRKNQGYVSPDTAAQNYADFVEPYDHDR